MLEDAALALQLAAQASPAVWLQRTAVEDEAEIAPGSTRLGGCPDLPAGVARPKRGRYPDLELRVKPHREDSVAPTAVGDGSGRSKSSCFAKRPGSTSQELTALFR